MSNTLENEAPALGEIAVPGVLALALAIAAFPLPSLVAQYFNVELETLREWYALPELKQEVERIGRTWAYERQITLDVLNEYRDRRHPIDNHGRYIHQESVKSASRALEAADRREGTYWRFIGANYAKSTDPLTDLHQAFYDSVFTKKAQS